MNRRPLLCALLLCLLSPVILMAGKRFVTYEEFGARGDGRADDFPAIVKAHAHANAKGLPVKARSGAVYYIGDSRETAVVKTDTDFSGARFIIDDTVLKFENRGREVFLVERDRPPYDVALSWPLGPNTRQVGRTFETAVMLVVKNDRVRHFIRWGANQNNGTPASDLVLVDRNGALDRSTPFVWEFPQMTSARAYPIEDRPITLKGGEFITLANQAESRYDYHNRGIRVCRSNVTLVGITHFVQRESDHGAPYTGFFSIGYCANIVLRGLVVTGHRTYKTIGAAGVPVSMGSYDLNADHAINVSFLDVRQSNDIHDNRYWGVLGTNFCKNLLYDRCRVSRFDAHQGVCNATIRNSELGHQGVSLIGYGLFLMENTVVHSNNLISLRVDYGSFWRGNIIVRNCVLVPRDKKATPCIIAGTYTGKHDFGYPCFMPFQIQVNGLKILDGAGRKYNGPCVFADFNRNYGPGYMETYPYIRPQTVIVRDVITESGMQIREAVNPSFFQNTRFDMP